MGGGLADASETPTCMTKMSEIPPAQTRCGRVNFMSREAVGVTGDVPTCVKLAVDLEHGGEDMQFLGENLDAECEG